MSNELDVMKSKMSKTINKLKDDMSGVRAGRANPAILDKINVDYYGSPTPIKQLGNISVPEPRMIIIQPWESNLLGEIEKQIMKSDIGINPSNDGKIIRLSFPPLTEERRRDLSKVVKKYGEEAKIAIRAVRRDTIEQFKKQKNSSEITEDDLKGLEKEVQNVTDLFVKNIDELVEHKEKEILEV